MNGVTVVICCHNSVRRLPKTIEFLAKQVVPENIPWEVVIVDNNSSDNTSEIAKELWGTYHNPTKLIVVLETTAGLSHARMKGALTAQYECLIFCDDDNWLFNNYVYQAFTLIHQNLSLGIIGGEGIPIANRPFPKWFEKYKGMFAVGLQKKGQKSDMEVYGAGMVIRRSILVESYAKYESIITDRIGTRLISGGDNEICYWTINQGFKIDATDTLKFFHFIEGKKLKLTYLFRLAFWIGYSRALLAPYRYKLENDKMVLTRKNIWQKDLLYTIKDLGSVRELVNFYHTLGGISLILKQRSYYDERIKKIYKDLD